jgi:uncharacterized repeat protein (TIGR02543 family)
VAAALALLFSACAMPGHNPGQDGKAAVRVGMTASGIQARTILPSAELSDVAKWKLWGGKAGDLETDLGEISGDGDTVYLEPGTWHFTLNGYKTGDALILQGSITDQNITGPGSISFKVAPVAEGSGTVAITVNLPDEHGITLAKVYKDGGSVGQFSITDENEKVVFEGSYSAGDYYFSIELYKVDELYGVVSEMAQIRGNLTSTQKYTLTQDDLKRTYKVTFDKNKGDTEADPPTKIVAVPATHIDALPTPPNRSGFAFKGWNTASNGTGSSFTEATTVSAAITVYAQWSAQFTVTLNSDAGTGAFDLEGFALSVGESRTVAVTTDSSYTHPRWFVDGDLKVTTPENQITLSGADYNDSLGKHYLTLIISKNGVSWSKEIAFSVVAGTLKAKLEAALDAASGTTYTITLSGLETDLGSFAPQLLNVTGNKDVTIILDGGKTVQLGSNGSLFTLGAATGSKLTLELRNITLQGKSGNNAPLVQVNSRGALVMKDGSHITGNTNSSSSSNVLGSGVSVASGGAFTMSGGEVRGNTASGNASASAYGGGVYVAGTFGMSGGEVSGNNATATNKNSSGGGVSVASGGAFPMSGGGEVSGNEATASIANGGGVYVGGTFKMSGGAVSGNTATNGGGVFVAANNAFKMSGGTVSGNTATNGGGVSVNTQGTFTKSGDSTIYGDTNTEHTPNSNENTASSGNGHAVYVDTGSKKRNSTAGESDNLDSTKSGAEGGWDE